jgi:hypothetical protein
MATRSWCARSRLPSRSSEGVNFHPSSGGQFSLVVDNLDLAVLIDSTLPLTDKDHERLIPLFTLQGVQAGQPQLWADRVQPMGGLIDSFPVVAGVPEQEE